MHFAVAAPEALGEIARLINGAYRGDEGRVGWTHEGDLVAGARTSAEELRADLAGNPKAMILVARDAPDGQLLGSVWLNPVDAEVWYLGLLAVRVDGQARGVGRALLAQAETVALSRGARRMRLTVIHVRETLAAWYGRCGYHPTGRSEPFPSQYVTLRDGLQLLILEKALGG